MFWSGATPGFGGGGGGGMPLSAPARPMLVDGSMRRCLNATLHHCRVFKDQYYDMIWNIGLFLAMIVGVGLFLFLSYRGKPTADELAAKEHEKKQYLLEKIKMFQEMRRQFQQQLITNLPQWEAL